MKINWKAIPDALKVVGRFGEKHLPTILTGVGIVGFVGTAILVAKEAPKAETAVKKATKEKAEATGSEEAKLNAWEYVKTTSGYYWPSFALGTASTIALISAHKIDLARLGSLTLAYQASKGELKDLKNKIIQKDGKEKLEEYEKSVHEDVLTACPPTYIYNTGKGTTIFYEPLSATYFYSDIWYVTRALQRMIDGCKSDGTYSLDELRDDLLLPKVPAVRDYMFYYESVSDISIDAVHDMFEYHSVSPDDGDMRPCIWLNIFDRCFNTCQSDRPSRYSFR